MERSEFILLAPLRAVHLSESLKGTIATLPIGARVCIAGTSSLPGFVEVVCANVQYNVFEEDLRGRASETPRHAAARNC